MKGRNTTCITIRLKDVVVKSLQEKAIKQGFSSPGEYIKSQIVKVYSEITMGKAYKEDTRSKTPSEITRKGYSKEEQLKKT